MAEREAARPRIETGTGRRASVPAHPAAPAGAAALASAVGNRAVARAAAAASGSPRRGLTPASALALAMRRATPSAVQRPLLQRDDVFGQGKAVDPNDNMCSLQWTPDKGWKWLMPSGVSCDPGVFGLKGSGDSFQYPYDYGDKPSGGVPGIDRPSGCPPERWEPPSQKNMFYGRCRPPAGADTGVMPLPPPAPAPQPGDYNAPDPDADQQTA